MAIVPFLIYVKLFYFLKWAIQLRNASFIVEK